ncbi:MAG: carboxypeptidase-like regulatory domain-containing protein [Polaromonas sp.]
MNIIASRTGKVAVAAALGALLTSGAFAQTPAPLPPVHKSGAVEYLSGGIGQDEATAIDKAGRQWPLTLEFAINNKHHADFVANVKVLVRDTKGHTALQATANGPFLLAKLAPGRYTVDATLDGQTLHQSVSVKPGQPARSVLVWPAGTDGTSS